jgi:hypothetical protein
MAELSFLLKSFCAQIIEREHLKLRVRVEFLDALSRSPFFQMDVTHKDDNGNYRFLQEPVWVSLPHSFAIRLTGEGQRPIERDWPPIPSVPRT